MPENKSLILVYYEDPFWVGVYQRSDAEGTQACRVVFGAEPTEAALYLYFLENWHRLPFGPPHKGGIEDDTPKNPKRARREAARLVRGNGAGTKAQQALQREREGQKLEGRANRRRQKKEGADRQFALRTEKKKQKHRGH